MYIVNFWEALIFIPKDKISFLSSFGQKNAEGNDCCIFAHNKQLQQLMQLLHLFFYIHTTVSQYFCIIFSDLVKSCMIMIHTLLLSPEIWKESVHYS